MAEPPRYSEPEPEAGDDTPSELGRESRPGMPRWVKVSLIVAAVLVVLVIVLLRIGGHEGGPGPGGHGLGRDAPASVVEGGVQQA